MDVAQISAQLILLFHQIGIKALPCQRQRGSHARQSSADDQGGLFYPDRLPVERLQQAGLGQRHADQVFGFLRGLLRLVHVHPGALVADVGHLKQVGIEAGLGQRVAEQRLVRSRGAGGHHHPIQMVFGDLLLDPILGIVGAGIKIVLRVHDVGQGLGIFHDIRDIDHAGDIGPAVADKDSDARLFSLHISFGWVDLGSDQRAAGFPQEREHLSGSRRGLHDSFRNIFGLGKRPGDKDSFPRRFRRPERGESRRS